jgi:hypothetical protein
LALQDGATASGLITTIRASTEHLAIMDHIPLPRNSIRPALRIPCLHNPEYDYDHLGWNSFPERKGFDLDPILLRQDPTKNFPDILSFIQTWFFFGVLTNYSTSYRILAISTRVEIIESSYSKSTLFSERTILLLWALSVGGRPMYHVYISIHMLYTPNIGELSL